ncbi:MAG: C69 family dipeptidase [Planctomycetota bacterium]
MTSRNVLLLFVLIFVSTACASQEPLSFQEISRIAAGAAAEEDARLGPRPEGCTCIMVGRSASADGSVITSHTCDGRYRTWMQITSGKKYTEEGAMAPIYTGRMKTEFPTDEQGVSELGAIPQAGETYGILDTAYPCMNEHQLAMGESTFGGRDELKSDEGMFYIEELQRIALERTRTARDAIRLMGSLAAEYGYIDSGECLAVADPKEVWHFEIQGPGQGRVGAVWAAVRIPDDHVGIAANISRISEIDLDNPDCYMASENVFSLAEEMGWWKADGNEPFKFWKAYSDVKPFRIREYWVLSKVAPSLNLDFVNAEELPLSVKAEAPVSVQDVFDFFRETYEGTEFALNCNLLVEKQETKPKDEGAKEGEEAKKEMEVCIYAHPWMSGSQQEMFNNLKPDTVTFHRPIAVMFNAYHTVIQCRDWLPDAVGGICWLGFDNPAATPRVPIFAGMKDLPPDYKMDSHKRYRTDSASWAFRRAARLACFRWGKNKEMMQEKARKIEEQALTDLPGIEQRFLTLMAEDPEAALDYITRYTITLCCSVTHQYWQLGDELWMDYLYRL